MTPGLLDTCHPPDSSFGESVSVMRNRILSAALLLPVVLLSVWTSFGLWRCQSDGIARSACCCPRPAQKHADAASPTDPDTANGWASVSGPSCCDLEQHEVDRAPAENSRRPAAILAAAVAAIPVAVLPVQDLVLLPARDLPLSGDGPPAGRTLLVQKQAFLI